MLTVKQEKFVRELLKGKTQRQAYKSAYDCSKMKDSTMDNKASQLFKQKEIRDRYEELRQEMQDDDTDETKKIRQMIIEQEKAIVNANYGDLIRLDVSEDGLDLRAVPRPEALKDFDMRAVQEMKYDTRGNLIIRLYDKQTAINTLREMYGIGNEEGNEEINIILKSAEGYDV